MMKASVLCLLSASLITACGPTGRDEDGEQGGSGSGSGVTETPRQCDKMDIVFIVDNSGSMDEEQQNLAANFPQFAAKIKSYMVSNGIRGDCIVIFAATIYYIDYELR
jgi:hypothetical protein